MYEEERPTLLEPIALSDLSSSSTQEALKQFSDYIWRFYREHGRSFPWRDTVDPYRILLSELMLQQTQTERVLPKYQFFLDTWPDFSSLAKATLLEVLSAWKGLGYNRRAVALRTIAQESENYGWTLPSDYDKLLELPMIGPATGAAIMAFSFQKQALYLETNIRRVLIHQFHAGEEKVKDRQLLQELDLLLDLQHDYKHWYYGLMDYGVYLKKQIVNPNRRSAHYTRQAKFENSNRQIRGMLLSVFTEQGPQDIKSLCQQLPFAPERIQACLDSLKDEGFIEQVSEASPRYGISSEC
jgi:A/G-specific adenine glycosylase